MMENRIEENRAAREHGNIEGNEERRYPRRQNAGINSRITEDEYDTRGMVNLQGGFVDLFGYSVEFVKEMPQSY